MSFTRSPLLLLVALMMSACSFMGGSDENRVDAGDFEMPDSVTIDLTGEAPLQPEQEAAKEQSAPASTAPDAIAIPNAEQAQPESAKSDQEPTKPALDADAAGVLERLNKPVGEAITRDPEQVKQAELAQSDYNRAIGELRKGNLDSAQARFKDLSAQYPALSGPIVNQAIILRKKGKTQEAYDLLQKSILQHGKNPHLLNELGVLSRQLGKFKQAQVSYESAIRVDERFAAAHYNLGVLADLYLHDPVLAKQEFEIYQTLIPEPDKKVSGWIIELQRRAARAP